MNEQINRKTEEMLKAAQQARLPENVAVMAQEGVAKAREAYDKMSAVAHDQAKVLEQVVVAQTAGAKALSDKLLQNVVANTESAFDAAQAMARSRSIPDAAKIQADFIQQQMAKAGEQTKEFFELSTRIAQQTFQTMNAAATKAFTPGKF